MSIGQAQLPAISPPPAHERLGWSRFSDASLLGLLILCAAVPYANTLLNDFIFTYDDGTQILKNPYVHSFRYLREVFSTNVWSYLATNTVTNYYRPVMTAGYLLCYKLFGPVAYGFHLASVTIHSAVVCTLFLVTRRMNLDRGIAFAAAALFAFHPIHTEAVDWISAVTELELAFFFLATFWLFLELARPRGACSEPVKLGMAGCYLLTLLSKEQALTLPLLATLYEHFCRSDRAETSWKQKRSRYGALWLLSVAYILFRIHALGRFAPLLQRPSLSWEKAFLAALALCGQYLWKLVWPAHFLVYYPFPEDVRVLVPWMIAGLGALILFAFLFLGLLRRDRFAWFGLVWLGLTLAPVLNARWMASNVFGERYLYLPSAGFCWLTAWGWMACWRAAAARKAVPRQVLLAGAIGLISALCVIRIATRNRDWRNDLTLYTRTLDASPGSNRVMDALGLAYWEQGDIDAAEQEWRKVLVLDPNSKTTWNYLGVVLAQKKQFAGAARCFERSMQLDPVFPDAHLNLGAAYAEQGKMELAEMQFRAAVALSPLNVPARNVLGKLYFDGGRLRQAEEQFRQSVEIEPNVAGYDHLGYIYLRWGDRDRAEQAFKGALSVNASESSAHLNLGAIYAATGRQEQAVREYLAALASNPHDREAREALQKLRPQAPDSTRRIPDPRSD